MVKGVLESLRGFDELAVRVSGSCMDPVICDGALVLLKRQKVYLPGDIVTYRNGIGQLVCHRFLGYRPGPGGWRALTQADEAAMPDASVRPGRLLGKVVASDRRPVPVTLKDRGQAVLKYVQALRPRLAPKRPGGRL